MDKEWIKIIISVLILVVMILGLLQIQQINVELDEITASKIEVGQIAADILIYRNESDDIIWCKYYNGTHLIEESPCSYPNIK